MTGYPERCEGTIKRLIRDKGFGFITGPKGDVFCHRSGGDPAVFDLLEVGNVVTYIEQAGPKGLRALDVQPLGATET